MAKTGERNKNQAAEEQTPAVEEVKVATDTPTVETPAVETPVVAPAKVKTDKPQEALETGEEDKAKAEIVKTIAIPKVILPELTERTLPFYRELMIYAGEEGLDKLKKDLYNALIIYYKIKLAKSCAIAQTSKSPKS